ncbi:MAG: hypothetical protein ACYTEQ_24190 [Planctomycetota bacterium]|jgi:hypothetical protein
MSKEASPMRAIRLKCMDCCGGSYTEVKYCPCDGVHSGLCSLWHLRFGYRPVTATQKFGKRFLDPGQMPGKIP